MAPHSHVTAIGGPFRMAPGASYSRRRRRRPPSACAAGPRPRPRRPTEPSPQVQNPSGAIHTRQSAPLDGTDQAPHEAAPHPRGVGSDHHEADLPLADEPDRARTGRAEHAQQLDVDAAVGEALRGRADRVAVVLVRQDGAVGAVQDERGAVQRQAHEVDDHEMRAGLQRGLRRHPLGRRIDADRHGRQKDRPRAVAARRRLLRLSVTDTDHGPIVGSEERVPIC